MNKYQAYSKTEHEIFNQILLWATSYRIGVNPLAIAQKGATIENILDLIYQKGIEHGRTQVSKEISNTLGLPNSL